MRLESPYCEFDGLNLTWELLEGLAKHNGPVYAPTWALAELDAAFPLDLAQHASLEAQVAAISDDIAYDNHDIDDGLRAGILRGVEAESGEEFVAGGRTKFITGQDAKSLSRAGVDYLKLPTDEPILAKLRHFLKNRSSRRNA